MTEPRQLTESELKLIEIEGCLTTREAGWNPNFTDGLDSLHVIGRVSKNEDILFILDEHEEKYIGKLSALKDVSYVDAVELVRDLIYNQKTR